jgi:excisionase family DNA binding protein
MADTSLAPTASGRQRAKSTTTTIASGTRQSRPAREPANSRPRRTARDPGDEWLTVEEVCAELRIGRRTFERWRTLGVSPRATRPTRNRPLKIKRKWLEEWAEDGAT